jgi:meso-butanediol dehydrogenase / (S,S)-butanediol dehydrogenase / diacetyl reductase
LDFPTHSASIGSDAARRRHSTETFIDEGVELTTEKRNRVALVTGAGQGIGRGIALRLARDGFDIAVNDIPAAADNAQSVAKEVRALGRRATVALADVTDPAQIGAAVARTVADLGPLGVTVANAGIARVEQLIDVPVELWDRTFAINVRGVFLTFQAAARQYMEQGDGGKLIAAASQVAHRAAGGFAAYSSSKFAVRGLVQAAAQEWAPHRITVNAYAPGVVDTALWDGDKDLQAQIVPSIPLGRLQTPDDVAALVSFLASPDSDYMTGQTVISDGGMVFA